MKEDLTTPALLEAPEAWRDSWVDMPSYNHERLIDPNLRVCVHFRTPADREAFLLLMGNQVVQQGSIWYPPVLLGNTRGKEHSDPGKVPRYPIYVISKGRWESRLTVKALDAIGVPYHVVVEPQEYAAYSAVIDPRLILQLPFSNLGQGSIPARNWVWEHSISTGAARHWILDDNIRSFHRLADNLKVRVTDGSTFAAVEDFTDRYTNVEMSGMNYYMFVPRKSADRIPPYRANTRVYSCILLRNDLPYRWRGRYNEDTDLSLRILKGGGATLLFNAFLCWKSTTMKMKGGNTDELYVHDGRLLMAQSLAEQHPDVVTVTRKWGRWQHQVDYRPFKKNPLDKPVTP